MKRRAFTTLIANQTASHIAARSCRRSVAGPKQADSWHAPSSRLRACGEGPSDR
jgi:hypothetical protein